jgi:hypothetical protein
MQKFSKIFAFFVLVTTTLYTLSSCVGGKHLRVKTFEDTEKISGIFNVILYGANHLNDLETIAILDLDGDGYEFTPYAPEFNYSVIKNLRGKEAMEGALHFISSHHSFHSSQIKMIFDERGNTLGYEFRPLYLTVVYGFSDILEVDYWLMEDNRIKVTIRLDPLIERGRFPEVNDF